MQLQWLRKSSSAGRHALASVGGAVNEQSLARTGCFVSLRRAEPSGSASSEAVGPQEQGSRGQKSCPSAACCSLANQNVFDLQLSSRGPSRRPVARAGCGSKLDSKMAAAAGTNIVAGRARSCSSLFEPNSLRRPAARADLINQNRADRRRASSPSEWISFYVSFTHSHCVGLPAGSRAAAGFHMAPGQGSHPTTGRRRLQARPFEV